MAAALQFWPVFLIVVIDRDRGAWLWLIIGIAVLIALSVEAVRYLRFDYRLEGTTLVVRYGVIVRRTRTVPADRVQQVSRNEKLRHRLFGVAELAVEVAGAGNEPDVKLSVVAVAEAERIRVRLQDARRQSGAAPPQPDEVVYQQPNAALIKWSAVASPLFIITVVGALFGGVGDVIDIERAWSWLPAGGELWFVALAALLGLAAATAINVARFYDMRLVQAGRDLRLDYGLLTRRNLELPSARIQALVVKLGIAGRLSATVGLTVHNASSGGETTNSFFPAIPKTDSAGVARRLIPGSEVAGPLVAHPRAALRRSIIRWTWPVAIASTIASIALQSPPAAALLLLVLPAAALGWRAYRVLGHRESDRLVVARRGPVVERTTIVRRARVQSVSVAANWFQRRQGLATLRIQVAQPLGKVSIRDMAAIEAGDLATRLVGGISVADDFRPGRGGSNGGEDEAREQRQEQDTLDT